MKAQKACLLAAIIISLTACTENVTVQEKKQEGIISPPPAQQVTTATDLTLQVDAIKDDKENRVRRIKSKPMYEISAAKSAFLSAPAGHYNSVHQPASAWNRESYEAVSENGFINCLNDPLSTFSIDVDTASYANIRRFLNNGSLPAIGAIRIEEMINYFNYDYPQPKGKQPLSIITETGPSPFNKGYGLVKIGIKAKDIDVSNLPPSNLVFLIDVSGSMNSPNKLTLLKKSMKLVVDKLGSQDRVSIVTYAGSNRIALMPTNGDKEKEIFAAIDAMHSGGSTNGADGIVTAYKLAQQVFIPGGNNRIILASDGDFNVGVTSRGELQKLIEEKRKTGVYLTVLGFGMGNLHDDTMEILANKGNGNYAYIDSLLEAKKVLVKEIGATFFAVANDVKIQVEFNPAKVGGYRLIGYENRALNDEDFKDDTKDAGEIGAGHTVTALYEIIPVGSSSIPKVNGLKYQQIKTISSNEMLTVKVRYKNKISSSSKEISQIVKQQNKSLDKTSKDFRFAIAVAGYGMILRGSEYNQEFDWKDCLKLAKTGRGKDDNGYRAEFIRLVELSELIAKQK